MDEKTGIVYGLHHLGVTDPKRQDYHNLAVSFREIRDDVRDRFPRVYKEIGAHRKRRTDLATYEP